MGKRTFAHCSSGQKRKTHIMGERNTEKSKDRLEREWRDENQPTKYRRVGKREKNQRGADSSQAREENRKTGEENKTETWKHKNIF